MRGHPSHEVAGTSTGQASPYVQPAREWPIDTWFGSRMEEIRAATGLDKGGCSAAIERLLATKKVRKLGNARATKYTFQSRSSGSMYSAGEGRGGDVNIQGGPGGSDGPGGHVKFQGGR